jgi:endonuclease III related protein
MDDGLNWQSDMPNPAPADSIAAIYVTLASAWGRQHWWPAQSRFEVIVGAYLTQNTSWANVETALSTLRKAGVLNLTGIRNLPLRRLESLIRSSGYFRQKARRLKTFVKFLDQRYRGSLTRMFAEPTHKLRDQLLALNGVGPETADSILLYAGQHPIFVVDAYTRRIAARHGILPEKAPYENLRSRFERSLTQISCFPVGDARNAGGASHKPSPMSLAKRSRQAQLFNEMHGLIVGVGKNYCMKSAPKCDACPLKPLLPKAATLN